MKNKTFEGNSFIFFPFIGKQNIVIMDQICKKMFYVTTKSVIIKSTYTFFVIFAASHDLPFVPLLMLPKLSVTRIKTCSFKVKYKVQSVQGLSNRYD